VVSVKENFHATDHVKVEFGACAIPQLLRVECSISFRLRLPSKGNWHPKAPTPNPLPG
jgi:hypothetical protein